MLNGRSDKMAFPWFGFFDSWKTTVLTNLLYLLVLKGDANNFNLIIKQWSTVKEKDPWIIMSNDMMQQNVHRKKA